MAKILAFTIPTPGHLFPIIPILHELRRHGHEVVLCLCSGAGALDIVAGLTVRWLSWDEMGNRNASDPQSNGAFTAFKLYGRTFAEAVQQAAVSERAELLVVDPSLWGAMIAAQGLRLPWAAIAHNPLYLRGTGLDVRGLGLPPARNLAQKLMVNTAMRIQSALQNHRSLGLLNEVRQAYRLRPLTRFVDLYLEPPLTIATTAEPFEYPRSDWPATLHFVGPIWWDPPSSLPRDFESHTARPRILLVGSSIPEFGAAKQWIPIAIEALATMQCHVVATIPTGDLPSRVPPNVELHRFLPHGTILQNIDCVVCHGGPGIVQRALSAGVPVVAVPFLYDRFEVARRIEVAKAGAMVRGDTLSAARLQAAVSQALSSKSGAEIICKAFAAASGASAAATAIARLL